MEYELKKPLQVYSKDKGEYEKVINIVLKASQTEPRIRRLLK